MNSYRIAMSVMFLIFGCILNNLKFSNGDITKSLWSTHSFTEIVNLRYYRSLGQLSRIKCIGSCTKMFDCDQIYMEDKICYCLAPGYIPLSDPMISGEVTLTIHNSIYQIYHDKFECVDRNYTLFTGTNYCLKLVTTMVPWIDAEQNCKQDGGHLVSVETPDKLTNVLSVSQNLSGFYTSGYLPPEATDNSIYRWVSHERVSNSLWFPGEPQGTYAEHRVELGKSGKFKNTEGLKNSESVCEILINEFD